jgi:GNAT superfamily N-acetyltransferase
LSIREHLETEIDSGRVVLRPVEIPADDSFLLRVYSSTREEELKQVDWPAETKDSFLRMQFYAQRDHYHLHYSDAEFLVILLDQDPVGRLYVMRLKDEYRLVDIALVPQFRGLGIGRALLERLLRLAEADHIAVRIHVERLNPALSLYQRLGFKLVEDKGVYLFLEWIK